MPQRPPTLAERIRSVLGSDADPTTPSCSTPRHAPNDKGAAFADRLRTAVAARR